MEWFEINVANFSSDGRSKVAAEENAEEKWSNCNTRVLHIKMMIGYFL